MTVQVQTELFDLGELTRSLHAEDPGVGAVATFVGYVRDLNQGDQVSELFLEHYPGMTERSLQQIIDQAHQRWPLQRVTIVHRVGALKVGEPDRVCRRCQRTSPGSLRCLQLFDGLPEDSRTVLEA